LASLFFNAFPVIASRFPGKHPVNHELTRYGNLKEISARLDREMAGHTETFGPFRFTATFLIYDSGHEFQMVPYDQIVSAEIESDPASITVRCRTGKRYQWFRTWMQGIFDPEKTLEKIRAVISVNDESAIDERPTPSD
jgi:hypothetical protein